MTGRQLFGSIVVAVFGAYGVMAGVPVVLASAEPCPDVEVVFARGTGEPPGVGGVGQAFVDAVRGQSGGRSVGAYAVNYPASDDFADLPVFESNVVDGIRDARIRVQFMAANCPNTRLVLGGYSQGAAVLGFTTADALPAAEVPAELLPAPMLPDIADHVAAVVLFGTPAGEFVRKYNAPSVEIGARFADRTLELCAPGDGVCDGLPESGPNLAHGSYPFNGMVGEGAAYAVGRL